MKSPDPAGLTFDDTGLIAAIAQDAATGTVPKPKGAVEERRDLGQPAARPVDPGGL